VTTLLDTPTVKSVATPAPSRRLDPLAPLRHSLTLTWRSLVKLKKQPEQLMDLTLQPILFIVMFVYLFGGAIEGNTHDYLQYVLPGLLVQTILFATLGTGMGLASDINKGVFDRFRSLPISRMAPLAGAIMGDVVRFILGTIVTLGFGAIIGFRIQTGVLPTLAAIALVLTFAFSLCWVAALLGVTLRHERTVQGVGFMTMFPLTFGANIFAKTETMPGWLQAWVKVNPVSHLTSAVRGLLVEGPVASHVLITLAWAAGITAVAAPLAVRTYKRKA
jgi:oleandomycin transport system permease protein